MAAVNSCMVSRAEVPTTRNENTRATTRYFAAKMIAWNVEEPFSPADERGGWVGPAKKFCENKSCGARCYEITSSTKNRIAYRVLGGTRRVALYECKRGGGRWYFATIEKRMGATGGRHRRLQWIGKDVGKVRFWRKVDWKTGRNFFRISSDRRERGATNRDKASPSRRIYDPILFLWTASNK